MKSAFRWAALGLVAAISGASAAELPDVAALRAEVRGMGWIVFAAKSGAGDLDLFVCRPDGTEKRNLTRTPDFNEGLPRFSRDGARLLYRRIPRADSFDNNSHGEQGVPMLARADGSDARPLGDDGAFPWASWGPDGKQILCLSPKGFSVVDLERRAAIRTFPRKGFFQQSTWSPDGRWLVGVANSFGTSWSIARMNIEGGAPGAVNRIDCCTPDWFPDSTNVVFSWRPPKPDGSEGPWTQLWRADAGGASRQLLYAEDGRHVYGGCVSPDGHYVLFTGNAVEDGDPANGGGPMGLMRLADAPILGGDSVEMRTRHPGARRGPVLVLPAGWEPHWTGGEAPAGKATP